MVKVLRNFEYLAEFIINGEDICDSMLSVCDKLEQQQEEDSPNLIDLNRAQATILYAKASIQIITCIEKTQQTVEKVLAIREKHLTDFMLTRLAVKTLLVFD